MIQKANMSTMWEGKEKYMGACKKTDKKQGAGGLRLES
jgi:hypothetical protein